MDSAGCDATQDAVKNDGQHALNDCPHQENLINLQTPRRFES